MESGLHFFFEARRTASEPWDGSPSVGFFSFCFILFIYLFFGRAKNENRNKNKTQTATLEIGRQRRRRLPSRIQLLKKKKDNKQTNKQTKKFGSTS